MEINKPEILAEVSALFEQYETALVTNDVETLDRLFWHSEQVVRLGIAENLYGHEQILAFRKSRPGKGMDRVRQNQVITTFGDNFAMATTEFRRDSTTRIGRQSQAWVRHPDPVGWKIVSAHVSLMDD